MKDDELEILTGFQTESLRLLAQMSPILDLCEGELSQALRLEDYGNLVDRIMGGAKSLALVINNPDHVINKVAAYSEILKAVSYKTSQITDNDAFYDICSGLLCDANEVLVQMTKRLLVMTNDDVKSLVHHKMIERLSWVSGKFSSEYRASVGTKKPRMKQADIDELLKKLGV